MSKQTRNGKAFEFAFAETLYIELHQSQEVLLEENSSLHVARDYFKQLGETTQRNLRKAAKAAVVTLGRLEPQLFYPDGNEPLIVSLQPDERGEGGDVRDVLFVRSQNNWEIGVSVKHNHTAVKHSRLSEDIDFGQKWLGLPCGDSYFTEIKPLFTELRHLKAEGVLWRDIDDKAERFYLPLLNAFKKELKRLSEVYGPVVPEQMLRYLIGSKDFYKVIAKENDRMTHIQAFSLYGTLNRPSGTVQPVVKLPTVRFPNTFYSIDLKPDSNNTLFVIMNDGWQLSLRIHSASTKVEPSLKFDVTLIGQPTFYSHYETWD